MKQWMVELKSKVESKFREKFLTVETLRRIPACTQNVPPPSGALAISQFQDPVPSIHPTSNIGTLVLWDPHPNQSGQ